MSALKIAHPINDGANHGIKAPAGLMSPSKPQTIDPKNNPKQFGDNNPWWLSEDDSFNSL